MLQILEKTRVRFTLYAVDSRIEFLRDYFRITSQGKEGLLRVFRSAYEDNRLPLFPKENKDDALILARIRKEVDLYCQTGELPFYVSDTLNYRS